jgi:hypothetical protein
MAEREDRLTGAAPEDDIPPLPLGAVDPREALEFEPPRRRRRRSLRWLWWGVALVLLVGGGALAWRAVGGVGGLFAGGGKAGGEVPLIRAEAGLVKVRPEQPGGMEVPDRDKTIYDRIGENTGQPPVERLLPPPETPLPPPKPAARPAPVPAPATKVEPPPAPSPPPAPAQAAPQPAPSPPPAQPASPPKVASVPPAAAGKGFKDAFSVQLAAARSPEQAKGEWERLRRKHADLLGSLESTVVAADLGEKGVFHRLRAGPLKDEAAARALCAKLAEQKTGCLVVRPGQ